MLVQSGKPVGVIRTHEWAPRVLIANSNLVGDWATWPEFRRLEHLGLTMYGQMTAGSWIYIGTQGIVQGTYETFAAIADKRYAGTLAGTLTLTGGCGGMGGAQPLAVTLNGGVCLIVDVDPARLDRRVEHRYLDEVADDLDDAVEIALAAKRTAAPGRWASSATPPRSSPSCCAAGSTSTSSPTRPRRTTRCPICPRASTLDDWHDYAERKPEEFTDRARESMAHHVEAMVGFLDAGAEVFDYGNSIRDEARQGGYDRAFDFPGFVPAYIRPLFCEGKGPFRWAALSGDPKDIAATDEAVLDSSPTTTACTAGSTRRAGADRLPGLAGADLLARLRRARPCRAGLQRPRRQRRRERARSSSGATTSTAARWPAPIARPRRCSTAPTRSPTGRCSTRCSTPPPGATWVSIHHGGGVGIGRSIHAGQVSVADGTDLAAEKLARVLTNDPGMGVIRHVDAGLRPRRAHRRRAGCPHPDARVLTRRVQAGPTPHTRRPHPDFVRLRCGPSPRSGSFPHASRTKSGPRGGR
jgi:urocanate hydratase